ncbi:MAG: SIMPL domain-containing protein [Gammaproteobacteria bacterium]
MLRIIVLGLFLFAANTAGAAESEAPSRNLVTLSVSAEEEVDSDLLVVRLVATHEAVKQAQAAKRVNEDMAWALAAARQSSGIRAQTLDYRTNPVYDDRRITAWRMQQALRLESAERTALTELLGTLQERLAIEAISYEVSPTVRVATEERLIEAAIQRFGERAERITRAFGHTRYAIVNVNVGTSGYQPPPMPYQGRALAMKAEMADPSIEAGQQTLSVNVDGTIELGRE